MKKDDIGEHKHGSSSIRDIDREENLNNWRITYKYFGKNGRFDEAE